MHKLSGLQEVAQQCTSGDQQEAVLITVTVYFQASLMRMTGERVPLRLPACIGFTLKLRTSAFLAVLCEALQMY